MEVMQRNRRWRVRWMIADVAYASPEAGAPAARQLCARCDRSSGWIDLADPGVMPEPYVVYACETCGARTAHAELPVTPRRIGD